MAAKKKTTKKKATKKKKATGTAVAKRKANVPAGAYDYGEDADAGFENMRREEFAIPFLRVLQQMSPQCDRNSGIKDAAPGMLFNTVTQDVFGEVEVIPCHRSHTFIEWIPRDKGGGLVDIHDPGSDVVRTTKEGQSAFGKLEMENGNELIETYSIFALQLVGEKYEQVIINFSSTQIKSYQQWMTRASGVLVKQSDKRNVRPPLFAHIYRLTTTQRTNEMGKWYVISSDFSGGGADEARLPLDSELYMAARSFRAAAVDFAIESLKRAQQEEDDSDAM